MEPSRDSTGVASSRQLVRLRTPPAESIALLHAEASRQMDEVSKAKDSIDSRAAFITGLPGVVLSVFVGIFASYWTSPIPSGLFEGHPVIFWLAATLTFAVVGTLVAAVVLGVSVLQPREFIIGIELV